MRWGGGRQEDGFALAFALLVCVVLTIMGVAIVSYASANQHSAVADSASQLANGYAESGLNAGYSMIFHANSPGSNPSAANLLGCSGTAGPSNCSSPGYDCLSLATACPSGSYTPTAGTDAVYGYFSGTNPQTYNGFSVPASTWLIVSTGYARNAAGALDGKTMYGEVTITPLSSGAVASVWNHIFLTAPVDPNNPNVCQTTFAGNTLNITAPIYAIGNLCLTGNTDIVKESGQPVDVMVGGKLMMWGNTDSIGGDSGHPITSGVVVGGCSATLNQWTTSPCDNGSYRYWVTSKDTFIPQDAPALTNSQISSDYSSFDPGPSHPCTATNTGSYSGWATLANSAFDTNTSYDDSAGTFNLTPSSNYACISQNGSNVGQLIWNNTNKTLTINGNVFVDGNLSITQSFTYSGVGLIMAAGTIAFANQVNACAVTSCTFTNWQGSSGNNQMLSLDALAANNPAAISVPQNSTAFQGALWCQPSSGISIGGNTVDLQGPMSVGTINITGNTPNLEPLPVIKNMPIGAPVPPNTSASIGPLKIVG